MLFSSLLCCAFALGAMAAPYTEPKSGITVQAYQNTGATYTFGIALPTTPKSDFIGVLVGKGSGYAGISLGGAMLNKLLIAAWPNGNSILSSFRKAPSYGSPAVTSGTYSMIPIANGTYVNSSHFTYTFLCKNCILSDGTTFVASDPSGSFGFAYSAKAPTSKTSVTTAFPKHDSQGKYDLDVASAKTAKYDTWALYANASQAMTRVRFGG